MEILDGNTLLMDTIDGDTVGRSENLFNPILATRHEVLIRTSQ
jgi:hypothetical protein